MAKTFDSQLGNIEVDDHGFTRKKKGDWENILNHYPQQKIIDAADYSEIQDLKIQHGSIHPCIKIKINDEWKYLFFEAADPVQKTYNRINYMWKTWRQNH